MRVQCKVGYERLEWTGRGQGMRIQYAGVVYGIRVGYESTV